MIDPQGRVAQTVPQFEAAVLRRTVHGFTGATPYARWGNWLVVVAALLALLSQLPQIVKVVRRAHADERAALGRPVSIARVPRCGSHPNSFSIAAAAAAAPPSCRTAAAVACARFR